MVIRVDASAEAVLSGYGEAFDPIGFKTLGANSQGAQDHRHRREPDLRVHSDQLAANSVRVPLKGTCSDLAAAHRIVLEHRVGDAYPLAWLDSIVEFFHDGRVAATKGRRRSPRRSGGFVQCLA